MTRARTLALSLGWAVLGCSSGLACSTTTPAPAPTEAPAPPATPKKPAGDPQPKLPVGKVELETPPRAPLVIQAEVAATDTQRQMGLMFRETMGEDEGMLFLFGTERHQSFWMHNTLLPLDMLFIDSDWKVVGIVHDATPQTDDSRSVPKMSQYVLELNAGTAARHGLGEGTEVHFTPPPWIQLP